MSTPLKTDKFAAMAARQQQQAASPALGESETVTSTSSPPAKRDKFAAMAARQQGSPDAPVTTTATPPVKRDKLAAMAARQQQDTPPSATPAPVTTSSSAPIPTGGVPTALRRDKFAAVVEQTAAQTEQEQKEAEIREKENKVNELKRKCSQRDAIWADLDHAEELVIKLLDVAHDTSRALASPLVPLDDLPDRYQSVLQKIHSLVQPHAEQIHAYQQPTAINRMYQTRVEWRLAVEARDILDEYRALEEHECGQNANRGFKREIDDGSEHQPAKRVKR